MGRAGLGVPATGRRRVRQAQGVAAETPDPLEHIAAAGVLALFDDPRHLFPQPVDPGIGIGPAVA